MVKREVQHLDSEGLYNCVHAHWAAEPIPLGRRAAHQDRQFALSLEPETACFHARRDASRARASRYVRTGVLFNAVTHRKAWPNIDWQPECTGFIGEGGYYEACFYVHGCHSSGLVVLCGTRPSPKQRQR